MSDILRLHAAVMEATAPFETTGDDSAFVLDPGEVLDPSVIPYVTNFRRQASGPRFWPHITLGLGTLREAQLPPPFTADHLAVCQLGNNNTGRKILTA